MRRPSRFGILDFGVWIILTAMIVATVACTPEVTPPASSSPTPTPVAVQSTSPAIASPAAQADAAKSKVDALVGRWPGVEGTYLNVAKKGDKYSIEIANLDGPKTYDGTAKGDVIEFTRNGKAETIRAGSGAETGMKGFEKETNCVVVTKGSEGFCKK